MVNYLQTRFPNRRQSFALASKAIALTLLSLTTAASTTPALAICAAPQTFAGGWDSSWDNGDGTIQRSPLKIYTTASGILGTYEGGSYSGGYINGNRKVVGRWCTNGGGCQQGRFQFSLVNGAISGKWGCGSEVSNKKWTAYKPCNDTVLNPVRTYARRKR